ncbi:MAG: nucleotide exchange factor GrpE [Hydrogeniiclostridium sp.]
MAKENTSPEEQAVQQAEEVAGNKPEEEASQPEKESANSKKKIFSKGSKKEEELEKKIHELEEALSKQKDQFLRTAAEYDNYRKRSEREKAAVYADATAAAILEILPVEDNLERALAQKECSVEDLRKGVEMVQAQMKSCLEKLGVSEMGAEGESFDPAIHNAVMHIEDENLGENVIVQVLQKGYKIGEKVVRHAMVQVAN